VSGLLANLPWQAWLYLARQLPDMDAAAALRHAAECPACLDRIRAIRRDLALAS
jgi:hypothetical protein